MTPETERLLQHWRTHHFSHIRPFFCQIEAVEDAIWLTEVAPKVGKAGQKFLEHLKNANAEANPELFRLALKLATGAGKTTVMAMLIAWQTVNAVRHPAARSSPAASSSSPRASPSRTACASSSRTIPTATTKAASSSRATCSPTSARAKIVITNYHAFKLRERIEISKGGRPLLQGRRGEKLNTLETEGQMLQRVMPELMGLKNILVLNDEAHHCYREKPGDEDDEERPERRRQAGGRRRTTRPPASGSPASKRSSASSASARSSISRATPFFLRGSGYAEGTLFPWTMSDFSLMDAIECGIVKLPRVPVADNIPGDDMPMFRNLWEHIRTKMPKKGRGKAAGLDPLELPAELQTALEALYGHYAKTFELWQKARHRSPALLHRRLQQHLDLEARLRLHLRLPPHARRRRQDACTRPPRPVPQLSTSTAIRSHARARS